MLPAPSTAAAHHRRGPLRLGASQGRGAYTVLHLEITPSISHAAAAHHPRWAWALGVGMDNLLIHMFGRPSRLDAGVDAHTQTLDWHPDAQADFLGIGLEDVDDQPLATTIHVAGSLRRTVSGREDA